MVLVINTIDSVYLLLYIIVHIHLSVAPEPYSLRGTHVHISYYGVNCTPNFKQKTMITRCVWVVTTDEPVTNYKFYGHNINLHDQLNLSEHTSNIYKSRKRERRAIIQYRLQESHHINEYWFGGKNFKAGKYDLTFDKVNGSLENNMRGFYYDEYPNETGRANMNFLTTQFGPYGARFMFPSFDEPQFRAKFRITIMRPKDYNVISNAELKISIPRGNLIEDQFELTKSISPSSVAFTVSKMETSPIKKRNIHRIVARPEILNSKKHEYVLTLINNVYQEVEEFLKISCELDLLYHIALPSNRMVFESLGSYWGINHYKESVLIISNKTPPSKKERSTVAIAKLIAQQWFLSYIMVDSWRWIWVNEGLTNYLSYNITNKMYPDWKVKERLLLKTRKSMQDDSRCCSKSLDEDANRPSEIDGKFNKVTLQKGTALITMMERLIPPQVFTAGLANLIEEKKWSTYTSKNLYENMESILKLYNHYEKLNLPNKLEKIMTTWETQIGYPVLTVTRNYDEDNLDHVAISQMRFHSGTSKSVAIWQIPINFAASFNPKFGNTRPTHWLNVSHGVIVMKLLEKQHWVILNNQATYYYRVNYDETNWKAIAKVLKENHEAIHYLNRIQIIDDAFSLAEFAMLRYSIALDISEYIREEREYGPLRAMKRAFNSIKRKIAGSTSYTTFQNFIRSAVEYIFEKFQLLIPWQLTFDSENYHRNQRTMEFLFTWLCELSSRICTNLEMSRSNGTLHLHFMEDFEKHKLCTTMRKVDRSKWHRVFDKYKSNKNSNSQIHIFKALSCSEDRILQERFLNYVMTSEKDKLDEALGWIINQGITGMNVTLQFISDHFSDLLDIFVDSVMEDILNDIGSGVTTRKELEDIVQLSKRNSRYSYLIEPSISRAKHNLEWKEKHLKELNNYLKYKSSVGIKQYNINNNMYAIILIVSYSGNLILR